MVAIPFVMIVLFFVAMGKRGDALSGDLTGVQADELSCRVQVPGGAWRLNGTSATASDELFVVSAGADPLLDEVPALDCPQLLHRPLPRAWRVLLAFFPFIIVFQGVLGFKLSSRYVAPFALVVTVIVGVYFFTDSDEFANLTLAEIMGKVLLRVTDRFLWNLFDYASNLFSALLFLEVCKRWGIVESIREEVADVTDNASLLVLLVLFCIGLILAVVAPGGSNFLIAGSVLIKLKIDRKVSDEDAERIASRYDKRHEKCDREDCQHGTLSTAEKVEQDTSNRIGAVCLFGNALSSAFNLLGVCIVATAPLVAPDDSKETLAHVEREIGRAFSMGFFVLAALSPVVMQIIISERRWPWQKLADTGSPRNVATMLLVGLMYATVQWAVAGFVGPELPCLVAGGAALITFIVLVKGSAIYRREWPPSGRSRRYLLPFVLLMVVLLVIRLVKPLEDALTGANDPALQPYLAPRFSLGGHSKVSFPYLVAPVVIVTLIALVTPLLVPFREPSRKQLEAFTTPADDDKQRAYAQWQRMRMLATAAGKFKAAARRPASRRMRASAFWLRYRTVVWDSLAESAGDAKGILVSITAFAALAKLMAAFGMTQTIALALVDALAGAPAAYAFFIPVIGLTGSALTGSTTTSNFLFSSLQATTATRLGLVVPGVKNSVPEIVGLQMVGATAGELISPLNAVVITLMHGVDKSEAELIRDLLWVAVCWLVATMLLSFIFLVPQPFLD